MVIFVTKRWSLDGVILGMKEFIFCRIIDGPHRTIKTVQNSKLIQASILDFTWFLSNTFPPF